MVLKIAEMSDRLTAAVLGVLSTVYLATTVNVGLNGNHLWRQSDSYAQILSFLHYKDMVHWETFSSGVQVFDMPVYQVGIAAIVRATHADPLVVARLVNLVFWAAFLIAGYVLAERLGRRSGVFFVFFAATSPLMLHYFSTPFPDAATLACSLIAAAVLIGEPSRKGIVVASVLLALSAFVKSPIPFVVIVYLIARALIRSRREWKRFVVPLVVPAVAALAGTVGAEIIRKAVMGSRGPSSDYEIFWYFGTVAQRTSGDIWSTMLDRAATSFAVLPIAIVVAVAFLVSVILDPLRAVRLYLPPLLGFFAGWFVFTNVFLIHEYYELAVTALLFLVGAWSVQHVLERARVEVPFFERRRTA